MSKTCVVSIRRGALHFTSDVYERYFSGLANIVLLKHDDALVIMPVSHAAAGGYVIKTRNRRGDRAVGAEDFFREFGIDDETELTLSAQWSDEHAALIVQGVLT
jgi:hypothetical protein